ncbi:hypothetical protein ABRQ22_14610 [Cellulosimicrobium sp. ES-005]|uniref:Uncharacterized protein n=1 Tax=Cellulosimicrobium sp. ES-005 TaxID=3163031 RepID=A0AAU8FXB0_9MICO
MLTTNTTAPPPPAGPEAFLIMYALLVAASLALLNLAQVAP